MSNHFPDPFSFAQIKIQLLEELLDDAVLGDREFRLAAALILQHIQSFQKPCCTTDKELAEHLGGRSADTIARAVQALSKSGHFTIKRGARNRATEYAVSDEWRAAAQKRKIERQNMRSYEVLPTPQIEADNPANLQGTTPHICPAIIKDKNKKPYAREALRSEEEALQFEKIWQAYPEDRRRWRANCEKAFAKALQDGVEAETILRATSAYAEHSKSFSRSKVSFMDNWLWQQRWKEFEPQAQKNAELTDEQRLGILRRCADWIVGGTSLARQVSKQQIAQILELKLLTNEELLAAGIDP